MYEATTRAIKVTVTPIFLEEQSAPEAGRYVWAYRVRIENLGDRAVRLRSRHWSITDAAGQRQEVHGPGVVGQQPLLEPGERFDYTSGTPLRTPSGFMSGTYRMEAPDGELFDIQVPAFSLDSPHQSARLN